MKKTTLLLLASTLVYHCNIYAEENLNLHVTSEVTPEITAEKTPEITPEIIPEIIVTADFRANNLQTTASSLTVITDDIISSRNAQHLEEILNMAPNVNFSSGSSRSRFFQIRGIGERSQFKEPINPSVGMIIDDIDFTGDGAAATLFDVEQVEILRGPQGTRYGTNALAGLINIKTKAPSNKPDINIEATAADYDTYSLGVAAGGAIIEDKLQARIAIQQYQSDGFINNTWLDRDDTNNRDEFTARAKLRWLASDNLQLDFTLIHVDINNGYDAFSLDNNRNTLADEPGRDTQKTDALAINSRWNANDALIVETIISYANSDLEYSFDEDWTYVGIDADDLNIGTGEYSSFDQYLRDRNNYSFEFRLLSDEAGKIWGDSTSWVLGFYQLTRNEDLTRNYTYNASLFESEYNTDTTALYIQTNSALTEKLHLIFGLRMEQWNAEYQDSEALAIDTDDTLYGGKLGLDYQINQKQMLYTNISRGYKAGGVNTDGSLPVELRDFDTEYVWSSEIGIKSNWLENTLLTRFTLFYTKRKDQQVKGSIEVPKDVNNPSGPINFIDYVNNAAKGKNYGLEAEMDWRPINSLQLFANIGLLRTTLDEYVTPDTTWEPGIDMSGRDQAHAPHYQFAIGSQFNFSDYWYFRAEVEGKDAFYFSDRHNEQSKAYELFNAKIGFQGNHWHIAFWGRNLTDKEYATRGFGFANDPRDDYSSSGYTQLGEPRMIGVTVNWNL